MVNIKISHYVEHNLINKDLFLGLDECLDLSIIDLINSKIAIDIYKLLNRKLKGLSFDVSSSHQAPLS